MSGWFAASMVHAWCSDVTTWPDMLQLYEELGGSRLRPPTTTDIDEWIKPRLRRAFEDGTLIAVDASLLGQKKKQTEDGVHGQPTKVEPPPPPPAPRRPVAPPKTLHSFAIRFVDELGTAISGVDLQFSHGGSKDDGTTDGNGVARVEDSAATSAKAKVVDAKALRKAVKPRWDQARGDRKWLDESQGATVVPLRDDKLPAFDLAADKLRIVSVQPYVARGRLIGGFFDTNKTFILSSGLDAIRGLLRMYGEFPRSKMLIVGHTDTAGKPSFNDPLSLERAESLKDYLADNVDGWLNWYGTNISELKRWGSVEDRLMIAALPDASSREKGESPVRWFQRTRGLTVDGKAGPQTRTALVNEYMGLDGTSLPPGIDVIAHGCGENFPREATGDDAADPDNRRVEVFFFDGALGVQPKPAATVSKPSSTDYPEWDRRAKHTEDWQTDHDSSEILVRIIDDEGSAVSGARCWIENGASGLGEDADGALTSDAAGLVTVMPWPGVDKISLIWAAPGSTVRLEREIFIEVDEGNEAAMRRLSNLGYSASSLEEGVLDFQFDWRRDPTGLLSDIESDLVEWHDRGVVPKMGTASVAVASLDAVQGDGSSDEDLSDPSDTGIGVA